MAKSKFYEQIKSAVIEKEVENVYNKGINLYFNDVNIEHPFDCDGFIDTKTKGNHKLLKLIIEYKLDEMLTNKMARAKVLIQVIYYLKRFEQNGLVLPNVCMVGDVNECFVMHTNELLKYLDEDCDWTIAPSNAHNANPSLMAKIATDENINPFIFEVNEAFSFKNVSEKIIDLADNVQRYVRVTEHNIATIFDYFVRNVVKSTKNIQPNALVAIFMGVITDKDNYYQHPTKKNILVTPNGEVAINGDGFVSFFGYFDRTYTPQEKNKFAEISDRLVEDTKRRNTGEFYTPTLFVDYAHKMIEQKFGKDWKEKYIVWDNCCGTKNLTRDYRFAELYSSTLEDAELEISSRYNKEGTAFQFDFLNDSLDKLPNGLMSALKENKPIIFFINPPYATAGIQGEESKKGVAKTMVNEDMLTHNIGASSQNLYAQFLYRITMIKREFNLTNVHICLFSPTLFLTGTSWKGFRNIFLNEFAFSNAVQFKASHFADVADNWGISFSIWSNGQTIDKGNFNYTLIDSIEGEIEEIGSKVVYNIDGKETASKWCSSKLKRDIIYPTFTSGLKTKDGNRKYSEKAIGSFVNDSNNVDKNTQFVSMFANNADCGHLSTTLISPDNFTKCTALFSARKLIDKTWVNSKDEYLAPNEEHEKYNEFVNDSIVYSLFHSSSNQSSLRNVEYKGKKWNIKNEFFFMSKDEMVNLANENNNDECYEDARTDKDRYVYTLLENTELSDDAKAVLDKAREIVRETFAYRNIFNESNSDYQINNWDCGWYQIKALAKEFCKKKLEEFNILYKKLADKMRPMVYELGFLK